MKIVALSLLGGALWLGTTTDSLLGFLTLGVGLLVHAMKLSRDFGILAQKVEGLSDRITRLESRLDRKLRA